jgi:hypothetical protein
MLDPTPRQAALRALVSLGIDSGAGHDPCSLECEVLGSVFDYHLGRNTEFVTDVPRPNGLYDLTARRVYRYAAANSCRLLPGCNTGLEVSHVLRARRYQKLWKRRRVWQRRVVQPHRAVTALFGEGCMFLGRTSGERVILKFALHLGAQ